MKKLKSIRSVAVLLLFTTAPVLAAPAAVVETYAGAVGGVRTGQLAVYKGVPFAAPPVGALRWRAPQPVQPWPGVRPAKEFAPACMQTGVSMPGEAPPVVSEDCLYLNVWAPVRHDEAKRPVIVWIYGGGFTNGSASMPLYRGDRLAEKGTVVVTFGYRVGPFGFLALPALSGESFHHTSGNYGFLDQVAALRWVQQNIAAFGGDPDRVTVAGQSAGAASISVLMASPLAKGLFQRAIAESGGMFEPLALAPDYQLANAEKSGEAYAQSLGATSLAALRALPAQAFLTEKGASISHPVIDGYVLPKSPYDVFAAGQQNDVPLLVGSNANEARSLIADPDATTAATFESDIAKQWGALPPPLISAYPHATDAEARQARLDFERDLRFGWDMWAWARLQAETGKGDVFYYHFTHTPPFPKNSVYAGWGASHFAELWYVFDHLDQEPWPWRAADRRLADAISSYWVNFATSGNPNGTNLPRWPAFTPERPQVLYLDEPLSVGGVADLKTLRVFDDTYAAVRGVAFGKPRP